MSSSINLHSSSLCLFVTNYYIRGLGLGVGVGLGLPPGLGLPLGLGFGSGLASGVGLAVGLGIGDGDWLGVVVGVVVVGFDTSVPAAVGVFAILDVVNVHCDVDPATGVSVSLLPLFLPRNEMTGEFAPDICRATAV